LKAVAELYCQAAESAAAYGLLVGYHNHAKDLTIIDGKASHMHFLEHTPETVLWEANLFWVAKAGLDPQTFLREIGGRGRVLHFSDGLINSANTFIPYSAAGSGQLDLIAASKEASAAEYIGVSLDDFEGNLWEAIKESYRFLNTNKIALGNQ